MSFILSFEPLALEPREHAEAGGFVSFEGKVRNHAQGRSVILLEYEAYPEMATAQGNELVEEAMERFGLLDARVAHRLGTLNIGDTAVVVQAAAAHRREAFEACEWIMDQIKWRVPIWKRETYADGVSEWVHAGSAPAEPHSDQIRFERQMRLPQVGDVGQTNLQNARVLLVGVGGLAAGSLPPLVGAGIGAIGLVDADLVELSNLHRQTLFASSDAGRQKVERAAAFAKRLRPAIEVETHFEALSETNATRLVDSFDWVLDGTDSLDTKFLLNEVCRKLGKPLVTASVHQFEGQIMTILPDGPCLQCLFPEVPPDHCVGTCATSGVLGVVPGILGAMQANEVIKGILGLPTLDRQLALVDLLTLDVTRLERIFNPKCPICSGSERSSALEWDLQHLPTFDFDLIDIREIDEQPNLKRPHQRIPMTSCYEQTFVRPTVFVCATGRRSFRLAANLRAAGNRHVFSLLDGLCNPALK
ncbi:MAG TPA: ThiF family adenylyltransferase [Fimbriimonadaceae bacterium]|nr:ThiF family adenylyltransferase [Fimbriimonadaceae bacterium]